MLVTTDAWQPGPTIRTVVDGEVVQEASTGDAGVRPGAAGLLRLHDDHPAAGDIIATGTPGGVGHARKPPRYLSPDPGCRPPSMGSALWTTPAWQSTGEATVPARHDQVDDPRLAANLLTVRRGTAYFSRKLAELSDDDFDAPSLLPGWTRRHVIAHVGFNAGP